MLNIIEKSRKGAAIASARSYIKATETYVLTGQLNKNDKTLEKNNKYNVTTSTKVGDKTYESINSLVEIKGTKPNGSEDYITLGDTYSVVEAKLTINGYEILIKNDEVVSIIKNGKTEVIEVESITLDKTNISVEVGSTLELTTTIDPDNATDRTITWTSSDESIASVDSKGVVTGVKEGSATITVTTSNGKNATANITVYKAELLSSKVQVGDYVSYDVSPNSVSCMNSTSLKGWRVLSISGSTVTIIHAGQPECYYQNSDSSISITALNNMAQKYINNDYAESAHTVDYNEVVAFTGPSLVTSNDLIKTGASYWLASPGGYGGLYYLNLNGAIGDAWTYSSMGFRPVVVLKSNIKTTGKTTDAVGNTNAWNLIAP